MKSFALADCRRTSAGRASMKVKNRSSASRRARFWLPRSEIVMMRVKAIRRGIWFQALTKAERSYIGLILKVVDRVRSNFLAKVLGGIVKKLSSGLESKVVLDVIRIGNRLARKLSRIAQGWGNLSASQWVKNRGFIQYLSVSYVNAPATFRRGSEI